MTDHKAPQDPKKFVLIAFAGFVTVFVFTMIMMLWHGDFEHAANGETHYNTRVIEP